MMQARKLQSGEVPKPGQILIVVGEEETFRHAALVIRQGFDDEEAGRNIWPTWIAYSGCAPWGSPAYRQRRPWKLMSERAVCVIDDDSAESQIAASELASNLDDILDAAIAKTVGDHCSKQWDFRTICDPIE
jgi:hypothetical protein